MTESNKSQAALIAALQQVLAPIREEVASLKAQVEGQNVPRERKTQTREAIKNAPAPVKTLLTNLSPKLAGLRGMVKQAKANMLDKCAAHSLEAVQTYRAAGGQAARAFIANGAHDAEINTINGDEFTITVPCTTRDVRTGMVPGSAAFQYAIALEQELGVIGGTPAGKARGRPRGSVNRPKVTPQATPEAVQEADEDEADEPMSEIDRLNLELARGFGVVE